MEDSQVALLSTLWQLSRCGGCGRGVEGGLGGAGGGGGPGGPRVPRGGIQARIYVLALILAYHAQSTE